jgi:hypothetical protein
MVRRTPAAAAGAAAPARVGQRATDDERHFLVELPFGGIQDEGLGLRSSQATARPAEVFERGALAELRVELADQQQVGRVRHRVLAFQAHHRVPTE